MRYRQDEFEIFVDPSSRRKPTANVFVEAPARISAHIAMNVRAAVQKSATVAAA
ncbi:hypothetical protein [Shinella granuli]|uniref:hypothetical protein n=1 Tax=Shinella granuli TaxID=323621 RepID=UPI0013C2BBB6